MAKRTYAPGLARRLQGVARYYARYKASIDAQIVGDPHLGPDLANIITAINTVGGWASVDTKSKP